MSFEIKQGDALSVLKTLDSESIQCAITLQGHSLYIPDAYCVSVSAIHREAVAFDLLPKSAFCELPRQSLRACLDYARIGRFQFLGLSRPVGASKLNAASIAIEHQRRPTLECGNAIAVNVSQLLEGIA